MIHYVIFSKNRAAQLDLLLRSIKKFGQNEINVDIIYTYSNDDFKRGYDKLELPDFVQCYDKEYDFRSQVIQSVELFPDHLTGFLTDDSLFYGSIGDTQQIRNIMDTHNCYSFSPRNGLNTNLSNYWAGHQLPPLDIVYSENSLMIWDFTKQSYSYGYGRPISLDGHFHTQPQLLSLMKSSQWNHPRALDGIPRDSLAPYMMSYHQSVLVNISVNLSYEGYANNYGKKYSYSLDFLNDQFVAGKRIDLEHLLSTTDNIRCTHDEREFKLI